MIDSVLKGTGNSRFLKSAVPAGTSWADALAMLQAGTFPIDFNGINTEGFQQVGTPLNKANLLKDATAAQIGLPPSTTPDGMFQALGNTGELHVWRKTVVTKEPIPEVPGSYTLGTAQRILLGTRTTSQTNVQSTIKNISRSNSITVALDGSVSLENPSTFSVQIAPRTGTATARDVIGDYKYIMFTGATKGSYCNLGLPLNTVYFVDPNSTFTGAGYGSGERAYIASAQEVIGVPGSPTIPAGTTTTYPVSTNPKAYQEGDDAKPAGYVLEASKQMIAFKTTNSSYKYYAYNYAESISVSDDGTVSLVGALKASGRPFQTDSFNAAKGKFCQFIIEDWFDGYVSTEITGIVFIPSDAVFSVTTLQVTCSNVQPVTGYAAIPAGTTIEYLGKLGDKVRVQVVSYVGTGTYGSGKETKIPFSFPPKLLVIAMANTDRRTVFISVVETGTGLYLSADGSSSIYGSQEALVTHDGGTILLYSYSTSYGQMNASGETYIALAIG